MFAGSRQSRPSIDFDLVHEGVRALRDLSIADNLLALGAPAPLRQREETVDRIERAIEVQLIGDFVTYVSLLSDAGTLVRRGAAVQLFGPAAIVDGYAAGLIRADGESLLPIAMTGDVVLGVDALGAIGPTGALYASAARRVAPIAPSVTDYLRDLRAGTAQRRLEASIASALAASRTRARAAS
jgi:hypothetical protein